MLGKTHLYFGIAVVIVFVLTGQYMDREYAHLEGMEPVSRALFRAGHLYILLFGLIHAAYGTNYRPLATTWLRRVQYVGSAVMVVATALVVYAFFAELPTEEIERPLTRLSLYLTLAGVAVNGVAGIVGGVSSSEVEVLGGCRSDTVLRYDR